MHTDQGRAGQSRVRDRVWFEVSIAVTGAAAVAAGRPRSTARADAAAAGPVVLVALQHLPRRLARLRQAGQQADRTAAIRTANPAFDAKRL